MSEDQTNSGTDQEQTGQAGGAPDGQASGGGTHDANDGQPGGSDTGNPDGNPSAETIFDPAEFDRIVGALPDDVKGQVTALRKDLIGDYTKKTQSIADSRKKIEAYDQFVANPRQTVEQLATQLGYKLTPTNGQQQDQESQPRWNPDQGNPESWHDVVEFMVSKINNDVGSRIAPIYQKFQKFEKDSIESQLSQIDPSWQQYENSMRGNLQKHPTLVEDPALLYRMSVPSEVLESRATQKALARMEAKAKSGQVGSPSKTSKKPGDTVDAKPRSFQEAIALAKDSLSKQGIVKTSGG